MKSFIKNINQVSYFLLGTGIFILVGLIILFLNNKTALHITMNAGHNQYFDVFFKYFTHIGDGLFATLLVILLGVLFYRKYKWKFLLIGLTNLAVSGLIAQILKHFVFPDADRPIRFIGKKLLSLVQGVEMNEYYSFPSGHTTSAFALCIFLAYVFLPKKKMQLLFFVTALLVGYSRIYLSQHFLEDVVAGAFIGTTTFIVLIGLFRLFGVKLN